MLFKNFIFLYFMVLFMGTLVAVSANSWLVAWLGLEINLMMMIPVILFKSSFYFSEAGIKYFLIQAMASFLIMMNFMANMMVYNLYFMVSSEMIMMIALSLKAGLAPFHFWFPQIIMSLNWTQCAVIMTWQKIAPLFLISVFYDNFFVYFIIFLTGFVGFLGGFNQILTKVILAYSSITHSSWMALLSNSNIKSIIMYFLVYCILTLSMVLLCNKNSIKNMNHMSSMKSNSAMKMMILFSAVSLAGLPPFMGFSAKLMAIKSMMHSAPMIIMMSLISFSLLSLFYYFKFMYNTSMTSTNQPSLIKKADNNSYVTNFAILNILFNLMIPILTNFT